MTDTPEFVWEEELRTRLSPLVAELEPTIPVAALPTSATGMSDQIGESIVFLFPSSTGLDYNARAGYQDERKTVLVQVRLSKRTDRSNKKAITVATDLIKSWFVGFKLLPPANSPMELTRTNLYNVNTRENTWESEIEFSFMSRIYSSDPIPELIPEILRIAFKDEKDTIVEVNA